MLQKGDCLLDNRQSARQQGHAMRVTLGQTVCKMVYQVGGGPARRFWPGTAFETLVQISGQPLSPIPWSQEALTHPLL